MERWNEVGIVVKTEGIEEKAFVGEERRKVFIDWKEVV